MSDNRQRPDSAMVGTAGSTLASRLDGNPRSLSWVIDIGLLVTTIAAILTEDVVVWFHVIFVLLVVTALVLPLRGLVIRLVVWAVVATSLVTWDVVAHDTPSAELSELPILTVVIVLVFLVARSREESHQALRASQQLVRERLEADRDSLREQLEVSQRLDVLGRASNRIAHDLRGVLTIVQWCASDLLDDADERHRRRGREALEAAKRGVDLVDEMLALGREHTTDEPIVDVLDVLEGAVPLLEHLVPDDVLFEVQLPTHGAEIRMSRTEMMQILMNLLSNAVDATRPGGTIRLLVDVVDRVAAAAGKAQRMVTISVLDDGSGVDSAMLPTIFDPGVTTKRGSHSGLGLSTVWTIAARAGGTAEFVSTGRGSRVDIVVPVASEYRQRRVVIDVSDSHTSLLLHREFANLGFHVDDAPLAAAGDQPSFLIVVSDGTTSIERPELVSARAHLVDVGSVLGEPEAPLTVQQASVAVRRIVDEATRELRAA